MSSTCGGIVLSSDGSSATWVPVAATRGTGGVEVGETVLTRPGGHLGAEAAGEHGPSGLDAWPVVTGWRLLLLREL